MYPPGLFADTAELIALSQAAAEFDGMYISHMRDEGAQMLEAIDELITIAREADIPAEIYHLKSSGQQNWPLFDDALQMIEDARDDIAEVEVDRQDGARVGVLAYGATARPATANRSSESGAASGVPPSGSGSSA